MTNPHTREWFVNVINDIPPDEDDDELLDIIERAAETLRAMQENDE